jgi:hypothetical protein
LKSIPHNSAQGTLHAFTELPLQDDPKPSPENNDIHQQPKENAGVEIQKAAWHGSESAKLR